jgi:L-iditol 2-dehydrogenase
MYRIAGMKAIRLHGPADLRLEEMPEPPKPGRGEVLLAVKSVGICGSDLHTYQDARIGNTSLGGPLCLGHEFAGVVVAVGESALDGNGNALAPNTPVAVDPAQHCGHCEMCQKGHPNLCPNVVFVGLYPHDGALCERMIVPAHTCFPMPPGTDFGEGALLETLGVALHSVDLANIRVGDSAAIVGAGPIGLCILQVAKLAGAHPIFVSDKLPWRLDLAKKLGATAAFNRDREDVTASVLRETDNRGVDVAIEAAWADRSVQDAADMTRPGGRLVLVGIPGDDRLTMQHSTARRKGLTVRFARRMKHVYPRALALYRNGSVDLKSLIGHRFSLRETAKAFELNLRYEPGVAKVIIDV